MRENRPDFARYSALPDGRDEHVWRDLAALTGPDEHRTRDEVLRPGLARLSEDLSSGRWHRRHADLLDREALDVGYRLLVADL